PRGCEAVAAAPQIPARHHRCQVETLGVAKRLTQAATDGLELWVERLVEHLAVIRVHEQRVVPSQEALPDPGRVAADAPKMIRVIEHDLATVVDGRIVLVATIGVRRDPVGWAVEEN